MAIRTRRRSFTLGFASALILGVVEPVVARATARHPLTSADRINLPGVDNLYQVAPRLFRSAQPEHAGFINLRHKLGVLTDVSLREFHSDEELLQQTGISFVWVQINTWHIGDDGYDKLVRALSGIKRGERQGPVLVHCEHGSDRTGAIVALYRMLYQGWPREAALHEMMDGPFKFHNFWALAPTEWGNIPKTLRDIDLAALKRRVDAGTAA